MHKKRPDHHGRRAATSEEATAAAARRCFGGVAGAREAPADAPPPPPPPGEVRVVPVRVVVRAGGRRPSRADAGTRGRRCAGAGRRAAAAAAAEARVRVSGERATARRSWARRRRWVPAAGHRGGTRWIAGLAVPGAPLAQDAATATALEATVDARVETRERGRRRRRPRRVPVASRRRRRRHRAGRWPSTRSRRRRLAPPAGVMPTLPPGRCSVSRSPSTTSSRTTSTTSCWTLRASLSPPGAGRRPASRRAAEAALAACRPALRSPAGRSAAGRDSTAGAARDAAPAARPTTLRPPANPRTPAESRPRSLLPASAGVAGATGLPPCAQGSRRRRATRRPRLAVSLAGADDGAGAAGVDGATRTTALPSRGAKGRCHGDDVADSTVAQRGSRRSSRRASPRRRSPFLALGDRAGRGGVAAASAALLDDDDAADEEVDADAAPPEAPPFRRVDAAERCRVALTLSAPPGAPRLRRRCRTATSWCSSNRTPSRARRRRATSAVPLRDAVGDGSPSSPGNGQDRRRARRRRRVGRRRRRADVAHALNTGRRPPTAAPRPGRTTPSRSASPCVQRVARARAARSLPAPGQNADWRQVGATTVAGAPTRSARPRRRPQPRFRDAESAEPPRHAVAVRAGRRRADAPSTDRRDHGARRGPDAPDPRRGGRRRGRGRRGRVRAALDEAFAAGPGAERLGRQGADAGPARQRAPRRLPRAPPAGASRARRRSTRGACRAALESRAATRRRRSGAAALLERGDAAASAGVSRARRPPRAAPSARACPARRPRRSPALSRRDAPSTPPAAAGWRRRRPRRPRRRPRSS